MKNLTSLIILVLLSSELLAQTSLNDTIHWRAQRPLTYDDFKGEAMEFTGFVGENFCLLSANYNRPNTFAKTEYQIEAIWDRQKSWLAKDAQTKESLLFFQVCFDIYELHARLLRKKCAEFPRNTDPTQILQPTYNQAMSGLMEEYNMFRKETKMGSDSEAVLAWSDAIRQKLDQLQEFK
ncbi:MAG: hypothetical protein RL266_2411 [Bacteroidota bacterium]|jgi:hypothetical protein